MAGRALSTFTDQVTEQLRHGMVEGRWQKTLPGRKQLAEELGCSSWTVEEAVQRLVKEGMLVSPGPGRRREIVLKTGMMEPRALRVMILLYEDSERRESYIIDLLNRLRDAGHEAGFATKSMKDLGMNLQRVVRFVEKTEADAWVVQAGPRDILEWFSQQKVPTFALFGRNSQVPVPSVSLNKSEALIELADRLVELGHRRIVILAREERRKPIPGRLEQLFLDRLNEHGIKTGPYNFPDWGDDPKEFRQVLDSLFKHTPPTALIVDEPSLCVATLQHLSRLGLSAPEHLSLACTDASESFKWCEPSMAHIAWDGPPVMNRVVRWANKLSRGKISHGKHTSKVRLVQGGTIGPAPKSTLG